MLVTHGTSEKKRIQVLEKKLRDKDDQIEALEDRIEHLEDNNAKKKIKLVRLEHELKEVVSDVRDLGEAMAEIQDDYYRDVREGNAEKPEKVDKGTVTADIRRDNCHEKSSGSKSKET